MSQAPIDGRPTIWWPVFMKIWAGAWLNCVVWTERTTAALSAIVLKCGRSSDTSTPAGPTFSNE